MKRLSENRKIKKLPALVLAGVLSAALLAGCAAESASGSSGQTDTSDQADNGSTAVAEQTSTAASDEANGSSLYTDRDMEQEPDLSDAETISVSDGQDVTISTEGIYVIKGTAADATITVDAPDNAKVQLVLCGVSITNEDFPCIYVKECEKCFVTTTDSENTLKVTGEFTADGDTNTDAAIFSKSDLVLNGVGTLAVSSTDNGIVSKDGLKVTGGTYVIDCEEDALDAHDYIYICDGTFTIDSGKDGLHSEYDEDNTVGEIEISGGTFDIAAGDDGIQATTTLTINGGTFDISAVEGLEATQVTINGGDVTISASDDGINASQKTTALTDIFIKVNGGTIDVTMGSGDTDGFDSNGSIYIYGGTVSVTGQSTFDYDGEGVIEGGTVYVNGEEYTGSSLPNQMMGGGGQGGPSGNGGAPGGQQGGGAPGQPGGGF